MKKELIVIIMWLFAAVSATAGTIIVDDDAPADFDNFQAAIDSANDGDIIVVYPGIYTGTGNRDIDFLGKSVVVRSIDPNDPDTVNNTVIDCQDYSRAFIFRNGEGPDSVIAGLKITGGRIYGTNPKGGAIHCSGASPVIQNCIITENTVAGAIDQRARGGALYFEYADRAVVIGCTISNNSSLAGDGHSSSNSVAADGSDAFAGAVYCGVGSSVTIMDCQLTGNAAIAGDAGECNLWPAAGGDAYGGAVYVDPDALLSISNSTIRNNKASCGAGQGRDTGHDGDARGGAISCAGYSTLAIGNCLLSSNEAIGGKRACRSSVSGRVCSGGGAYGGAIELHEYAVVLVTNCTIVHNSVSVDTGAACGAGVYCGCSADVAIESTIIWGNAGCEQLDGSLIASYSDIEGGCTGQGNTDADPCFADPGHWDVNGTPLDSSDDFWVDGDYHLLPDSACIGAGDPNLPDEPDQKDIDGEPRIAAGRVDIGADEFATKQADLTTDGIINLKDFSTLVRSFACSPGDPDWNDLCDLEQDGNIDLCDVSMLTDNWLWQAPWYR